MKCCYLENGQSDGVPCKEQAVFEIESDHSIEGQRDHYQITQVCADHVGHLLEDGVSRVWPL